MKRGFLPSGAGRAAATAATAAIAVAGLLQMHSPANARPVTPASRGVNVTVEQGELRGIEATNMDAWLGIPYARPPVGDLRWQAPQPVEPWRGVRDATSFGNRCVQGTGWDPGYSTPKLTEDCLYLNVYAPDNARRDLPVLVWIHGGGFTGGAGQDTDPRQYVQRNDAIVVTINYRLGIMGYLNLPRLGTGSGGDARDITIDGQSAGSGAVCDMLASPQAKGLFERGILESGPCDTSGALPVAAADALGQKFATAAGCGTPATVVSCLKNAWTPNLVAAEQQVVVNSPTYGTAVLPKAPAQAITSGDWNKVPLIVGSVRSEAKLFDIADADITAAQYTALIQSTYGANAAAVLARYPVSDYPKPFYALAAVGTDSGNACESYWFASEVAAQNSPVYEEEFNDPTSPTLFGFQPPGIDMSNAHSAELAYLWNFTLGYRPLTATELAIGKQMDRYWGAFAASASPNVAGQVGWPLVTASEHPVLVLRPTGNTVTSSLFTAEHQCSFWATIEG